MSLFRWLTVRAEQRRATEQASTDEANAAARAALPPRHPTSHPCPVCRALIDPDGVVQHQQWHATHTPLQRIGDPL